MTAEQAALRGAETPSTTADQPLPVSGEGRIASLDFIRGIAVMGILAANIVAFGQPWSAYMYPASFLTEHGAVSDQLWIAQFVLIDGKMRGLFTLLFGAGLYLFMERAWARGSTRWLQVRRLLFLLMFGLIHFYFIWRGDILTYYALVGLVVLLFVKLEARTQLTIGLIGYVVGALVYAAMLVPLHFVAETPLGERAEFAEMRQELEKGKAQALSDDAVETPLIREGDYAAFVAHKLDTHLTEPLTNLALFAAETLPLMLIGLALYRLGLFSGGLDARRQRRWGWIGLALGGALTLLIALWVQSTGFSYYGTLAAIVGMSALPRLMMVLGLAALLSLWSVRVRGGLAERASAAGRMAFSNYLGTSIVMLFVFHGWAGGLFGKLDRPGLYLVVLTTWALMLAWSQPWLARFRFGPLEWLWRCLTYGRMFPLRR